MQMRQKATPESAVGFHLVMRSSHCQLGPDLVEVSTFHTQKARIERRPSRYFAKGESSKTMLSIVISPD